LCGRVRIVGCRTIIRPATVLAFTAPIAALPLGCAGNRTGGRFWGVSDGDNAAAQKGVIINLGVTSR
jgi:hypothetical protein